MMNRFQLDGKQALVTGGSRGIGLGIARGLAEAGAKVILTARGGDDLDRATTTLRESGHDAVAAPFDITQAEAIEGWYNGLTAQHGGIDILVNNAGMSRRGPAETLSLADWQAVVDLNLTAVFALCQAFARERIAAKKPGKIVNIGSLMCSASRPGTAPYSATKGGILLLTKSLALDWAKHQIHVNAIGPGYIETPLTEPLKNDPKFNQWVTERCPLGRWGTPDDLASVAVFLAAPASDFVTGQIIYADGGWLAHI